MKKKKWTTLGFDFRIAMNTKKFIRTIIIIVILGSTFGCDQISKKLVRQKINDNEQIGLLRNYITITKIENSGAFLSIGQKLPQPAKLIILTILPLIAMGFALALLLTRHNVSALSIWGMCFIVGGGIGNIYDRIVHGSVTDFLHIDFVLFETGIFNVADVSIMSGMFLVIIDLCFNRKNSFLTNQAK
jgi:signal peptidase II